MVAFDPGPVQGVQQFTGARGVQGAVCRTGSPNVVSRTTPRESTSSPPNVAPESLPRGPAGPASKREGVALDREEPECAEDKDDEGGDTERLPCQSGFLLRDFGT